MYITLHSCNSNTSVLFKSLVSISDAYLFLSEEPSASLLPYAIKTLIIPAGVNIIVVKYITAACKLNFTTSNVTYML